MKATFVTVFCALLFVPSASAMAQELLITEAQRAQVEALRSEVAGQIQLQAYDLLDELVYGWNEQPVFGVETPVVLANVSVPVGFGSGLQALVETHFTSLMLKNPRARILLSHCPQCTSVVVHSGAKGTVISRGAEEPEALSEAGTASGSRHALFLDFEAEGASLVLRARITRLDSALMIVYAKTLSSSTSAPALLRSEDRLKSAADARKEYLDALQGRTVYLIPVRMVVRSYAAGNNGVAAPPLIFLQGGVEAPLTQSRAWLGNFSLGASWIPELHVGWLAQARVARLLSGSSSSLTHPDVYGFLGASVLSIHGTDALAFQDGVPDVSNIVELALGRDPRAIFAAFQLGLELRVKNRIGMGVFLESAPTLNDALALGTYLDFILPFQTVGAEVSFCF